MSKKLIPSRTPMVDIERCTENAGNKYDMILMASARAREISRHHKESQLSSHALPVVTALLELQEGQYGQEYLNKVK
jgi:DNA-directed RNA polymerase subunit K/omega